jgi:lactoylglutathione lyase
MLQPREAVKATLGSAPAVVIPSAPDWVDSELMPLIHTCYRITDIDRSVAFYNALGFEEIGRIPIRDEAVNVFMNIPGDGDMPRLELTYHLGVDSYDLGTGYGHIALSVEDLGATLARLAEQGIEPEKPPYSVREGGSRLCFVRDPDGYRIELIEQG